ncbi:MAG: alanine:cation symporter family protein, partial [Candidatus Eisenbacteria sp.]|nr:alanine:cation symporter family protein [Candidatus Eisenbacteria bacterium]
VERTTTAVSPWEKPTQKSPPPWSIAGKRTWSHCRAIEIAGVATAMVGGGPGAVFWMWVAAAVGMCAKSTCCLLA